MTEPKPAIRIEDCGDSVRVVTQDLKKMSGGYLDGRQNILTREYEDFFTLKAPDSGDCPRLRIGTAAHVGDNNGWSIHGANGIYAEVPVTERSVSEAERVWFQDHSIFVETESVVEFTIPHPNRLRTAILEQDISRFECLDAIIKDNEARHDILSSLQERIARWDVKQNQLHPERGLAVDLEGRWNPTNSDEKSKQQLYDIVSERNHAHKIDWADIAGYRYLSFHNARSRLIDTGAFRPYPFRLCSLNIGGYPDWTYCQVCGAVGPPTEFSNKSVDWTDELVRACSRCRQRE